MGCGWDKVADGTWYNFDAIDPYIYCGSTGLTKLKEFLIYSFYPTVGENEYRRFFDLLGDLHLKEETDTLHTIYFLKEE